MIEFDFITHDGFRASLDADYKELQANVASKSWKAVHVFAGSIIEAVLLDYLIAIKYKGETEEELLKFDLGRSIEACEKERIISSTTAKVSAAVKDYRNLIHPGRGLRLSQAVDGDTANVVLGLVGMIVKEVRAKKEATYGPTAEMLVTKIIRDPAATNFLTHLVCRMNPQEVEKLLLEAIPACYFEVLAQQKDPDSSPLLDLSLAFRTIFQLAPGIIKDKLTSKYVSILMSADARSRLNYERAFFRADDLRWASTEDRRLVVEHLLAQMRHKLTLDVLVVVDGIGEFLNQGDMRAFVVPIVRALYDEQSPEYLALLKNIVATARCDMSAECSEEGARVFDEHHKMAKQPDIRARIENFVDLFLLTPFDDAYKG